MYRRTTVLRQSESLLIWEQPRWGRRRPSFVSVFATRYLALSSVVDGPTAAATRAADPQVPQSRKNDCGDAGTHDYRWPRAIGKVLAKLTCRLWRSSSFPHQLHFS
jgi:hypothetical protein